MANVNPTSWRFISVLLLPGTKCYERFTDDTITSVRRQIIDGIAGKGLTPREKSRFAFVEDAFDNPGAFASKVAKDRADGLERKKQEVAEYKATVKAAEKEAADKAKKNARKRGKAKPIAVAKEVSEEDQPQPEVLRDPAGVKASLSHMQDEGAGGGGASEGESDAENSPTKAKAGLLDLTEQEGAADMIYIIGGHIPHPDSVRKLLTMDAGGKPGTVESSLLHVVMELSSHRPVRAGLQPPSHDLKKAAEEDFDTWKDLAFLDVKVDTPTEKLRDIGQIAKDLLRTVGDVAVDRYMYDEWLSAATIVTVPKTNAAFQEKETLSKMYYDKLINQLREDCGGVSLAVHCMAEAVVRAHVETPEAWTEFDAIVANQGDDSTAGEPSASSGSSVLLVVQDADETLRDIASAPGKNVLEAKIGAEKIVDIAFKLGSLLRVPGGMGRAGMPRKPTVSKEQRGMDRTELLKFVGAATDTLERAQWMSMFENMINDADPVNAKIWIDSGAFYKRTWRERVLPNTISQVVGRALSAARRKDLLTKYDPSTDRLLVAVHYPTAPGRARDEHFDTASSGCCSVPPGFARWSKSREAALASNIARAQKKYADLEDKFRMGEITQKQKERAQNKIAAKSARTVALTAPVLYNMDKALIEQVEDDLVTLFPADGAIVRIQKYKRTKTGGHHVWSTIEKDGTYFGMRQREPREFAHGGSNEKAPRPVTAGSRPTTAASKSSKKGSVAGSSRPSTAVDGNSTEYACVFVSEFPDGSRAVVDQGPAFPLKPDGHGTIRVTLTGRDGLAVEVGTDGSVCQRYDSASDKKPKAAFGEVCRQIIPGGRVIRYMEDGNVQVLFPNGQTSIYHASGEHAGCWIVTAAAGYRFKKSPAAITKSGKATSKSKGKTGATTPATGEEMTLPPGLSKMSRCPMKLSTDPISLCKIIERMDGVTIITYNDGSSLVTHADGTHILRQQGSGGEEDAGFVTISAKGFPKVESDIDVDENAFRHANGLRIALSKGGEQKRVGCVLSDGTIIEAMYNTKFTANVNGTMKVSKPDGSEIIASDDGCVEFRPASLSPADGGAAMEARKWGPDGSKVLSEALSEPDTTSGAYFIDCYKGELRTSDPENNIFTIRMDGTYELDLAGEDVKDIETPAIVNKPIEPRLFVLSGDGYGYEYCRPPDIDEYMRKIALDSTGTINCMDPSVAIERGFVRKGKGKAPAGSKVHTFMYEVLVRNRKLSEPCCMDRPPSPDRPYLVQPQPEPETRPREVIVVRNLEEVGELELELKSEIFTAERECAEWRDAREANQDRFAVDDTRDKEAIDTEKEVAAMIKKLREAPETLAKPKARKESRQRGRGKRGKRSNTPPSRPGEILDAGGSSLLSVESQGNELTAPSKLIVEGEDALTSVDENSLIIDNGNFEDQKSEEKSERNEVRRFGKSKRPSKNTDPLRDVGGFWKSMEGVEASQSIRHVEGNPLFEDENGPERAVDELAEWQEMQSTMMGTSPEMLKRAEDELKRGVQIVPLNKQIQPAPKSNKNLLAPLGGARKEKKIVPVGSARDMAAKANGLQKSNLSADEEMLLQQDYERLQNLGEEMAREIAAQRARSTIPSSEIEAGRKTGLVKLNRYNADDDEVRRKQNTSSTFSQNKVLKSRGSGGPRDYIPAEILQNAPGFEVDPQFVKLGRLCVGCLYRTVVSVMNVGNDTSRFRLTRRNQPAEDNAKYDGGRDSNVHKLRVLYRAGPLAAGMHAKLEIEFAALNIGEVSDHFELVTEHQVIRVPIEAEIVASLAHDPRHVANDVTFVRNL